MVLATTGVLAAATTSHPTTTLWQSHRWPHNTTSLQCPTRHRAVGQAALLYNQDYLGPSVRYVVMQAVSPWQSRRRRELTLTREGGHGVIESLVIA